MSDYDFLTIFLPKISFQIKFLNFAEQLTFRLLFSFFQKIHVKQRGQFYAKKSQKDIITLSRHFQKKRAAWVKEVVKRNRQFYD